MTKFADKIFLSTLACLLAACSTTGAVAPETAAEKPAAVAAGRENAAPKPAVAPRVEEKSKPAATKPPELAAAEIGVKPIAEPAPSKPPVAIVPPAATEVNSNKSESIFFPALGRKVDKNGEEILRRHALRLKKDPSLVVTLVAYSETYGSRSYNLAIAEDRIDSVTEILRSFGVARNQIRRLNAGRKAVAVGCETTGCSDQAQRVELSY